MKKIENICYELNKDFSEVKSLFIKEKLDKESLGEGLNIRIKNSSNSSFNKKNERKRY